LIDSYYTKNSGIHIKSGYTSSMVSGLKIQKNEPN